VTDDSAAIPRYLYPMEQMGGKGEKYGAQRSSLSEAGALDDIRSPVDGERAIIQGAFENYFITRRGIRLDEEPTPLDRDQLQREIRRHVKYIAGFGMNAEARYLGQIISPAVGVMFPGEPPTIHALFEIRSRDGLNLALNEPWVIPIERGIVMHHASISPGVYGHHLETLMSPRAFEGEVEKLLGMIERPAEFSTLFSRSYLYSAFRGHLAGLPQGWIPATRPLQSIEFVGTRVEPKFRLACGSHPEVVVGATYDPTTCVVKVGRVR